MVDVLNVRMLKELVGCFKLVLHHFNCSTQYSFTNIWLAFNSTPLAGRILFEYAALNYEVLGLTWVGACDLSPEATLYLSINVSSLLLLCGVDGETYINESLRILTTQVSSKNGTC